MITEPYGWSPLLYDFVGVFVNCLWEGSYE
jgi:hypothetical protein